MIPYLLLSLGLTLVFEVAFALCWGLRRRDLLLCVLVNVMTNPAVVLLHLLFPAPFVTALLELGAVGAEGFCYSRFGERVRKPWLFSLIVNAFSFGMGLMINGLM